MEVPSESFHWSSWDSRTCYPRRAFIQGLSDDKRKLAGMNREIFFQRYLWSRLNVGSVVLRRLSSKVAMNSQGLIMKLQPWDDFSFTG